MLTFSKHKLPSRANLRSLFAQPHWNPFEFSHFDWLSRSAPDADWLYFLHVKKAIREADWTYPFSDMWNIANIEFYLQGLFPQILAEYIINTLFWYVSFTYANIYEFVHTIAFGVLVSARASFWLDKKLGNSSSVTTKICQNWHFPPTALMKCVFKYPREGAFSKSSVFKMFFVHTKTQSRRFQINPVDFEERLRKVPFSVDNFSGLVYTVIRTGDVFKFSLIC